MFGQESNKDALAGATVPFGSFLAILKGRVKHIDRATKDMGMSNVGASGLDLRPQFIGRKTVSMRREMIVHPNSVQHGKGPQVKERLFRPSQQGMNEICACHVRDSTDGILGKSVLMMSTNPTET